LLTYTRVRTLTGKEIELDIEPDYKVRHPTAFYYPPHTIQTSSTANPQTQNDKVENIPADRL
jgi:hypothetical protein